MALLATLWLAVPTVTPTDPPGMATLVLIVGWILAGAGLAVVAAVIIAGVLIALGHGRGGEHGMRLVMALAGGIVIASAGLLVAGVGL